MIRIKEEAVKEPELVKSAPHWSRVGRLDEAKSAYAGGLDVATRNGDLQTKKEIQVFLGRLEARSP